MKPWLFPKRWPSLLFLLFVFLPPPPQVLTDYGTDHKSKGSLIKVTKFLSQRPKKKKLHWYEMKPFDDPVLEKKRLHCLSQKIFDDRRRYEMEILRAENTELKKENEDLKNEIARLRSKYSESDDDESLTDSSEQVVVPLSPVRSAGK